jgi:cation:H+ antiporter
MPYSILVISVSFLLLYIGTRFLVKGFFSSTPENNSLLSFAYLLKISITISAPSIFIAVLAVSLGFGKVVVGSLMGSNMFNLCFILEASAFILPVHTVLRINKHLILFLILSTLTFGILFSDRIISSAEGWGLFLLFIAYAAFNGWRLKDYNSGLPAEPQNNLLKQDHRWYAPYHFILGGVVILLAGSWLITSNLARVSESMGLSLTLFGLLIMAPGISIPLLVTAVRANRRKNTDLLTGMVVMSSIFNILVVIGIAAIAHPLDAFAISNFDLLACLGATLVHLQLLRKKYQLRRDEAVFLIAVYGMYIYYLLPHH